MDGCYVIRLEHEAWSIEMLNELKRWAAEQEEIYNTNIHQYLTEALEAEVLEGHRLIMATQQTFHEFFHVVSKPSLTTCH